MKENREKKEKVKDASSDIVSQIVADIENGFENRINERDSSKIRDYFKTVHQFKFDFRILMFIVLAGFVLFGFSEKTTSPLWANSQLLFSIYFAGLLFVRFEYDESVSTYVYIKNLNGTFEIPKDTKIEDIKKTREEINRHIEKKIFGKNMEINEKSYFILFAFAILFLALSYFFQQPRFLVALPILSLFCLMRFPFQGKK